MIISLKKLMQRNAGYNLLFNLTLLLNIICLIQLINVSVIVDWLVFFSVE